MLFTLAWAVVGAYSGYKVYQLLQRRVKPWFDLAFYSALTVISLTFIL